MLWSSRKVSSKRTAVWICEFVRPCLLSVCPYTLSILCSVIRHLKAGQGVGPYGARDKFRIDIYYEKKVIGRKLVPATLVDSAKAKEVWNRFRNLGEYLLFDLFARMS